MAQFGSASGLGPEGRRFKSCHSDHSFGERRLAAKATDFDSVIAGSSAAAPAK